MLGAVGCCWQQGSKCEPWGRSQGRTMGPIAGPCCGQRTAVAEAALLSPQCGMPARPISAPSRTLHQRLLTWLARRAVACCVMQDKADGMISHLASLAGTVGFCRAPAFRHCVCGLQAAHAFMTQCTLRTHCASHPAPACRRPADHLLCAQHPGILHPEAHWRAVPRPQQGECRTAFLLRCGGVTCMPIAAQAPRCQWAAVLLSTFRRC